MYSNNKHLVSPRTSSSNITTLALTLTILLAHACMGGATFIGTVYFADNKCSSSPLGGSLARVTCDKQRDTIFYSTYAPVHGLALRVNCTDSSCAACNSVGRSGTQLSGNFINGNWSASAGAGSGSLTGGGNAGAGGGGGGVSGSGSESESGDVEGSITTCSAATSGSSYIKAMAIYKDGNLPPIGSGYFSYTQYDDITCSSFNKRVWAPTSCSLNPDGGSTTAVCSFAAVTVSFYKSSDCTGGYITQTFPFACTSQTQFSYVAGQCFISSTINTNKTGNSPTTGNQVGASVGGGGSSPSSTSSFSRGTTGSTLYTVVAGASSLLNLQEVFKVISVVVSFMLIMV